MKKFLGVALAVAVASALSLQFIGAQAAADGGPVTIVGADTTPATYTGSLPSLSGAHAPVDAGAGEGEEREIKRGLPRATDKATVTDVALQSTALPAAPTTAGAGFDGIGVGLAGFSPDAAPPDTTGAVGATQYVQWVNSDLAVFDKTNGALLLGPVPGNTLFASLGGPCAVTNDGDPVVLYDKAAQRWVVSQFSVSQGDTAGYWQCVAVSQGSDATAGWNLYAFQYSQFNDYPKMGVWSDGYYITFNMFGATSFAGARMCAYDRAAMLAGQPATQQCQQISTIASVLPADIDGSTAPPAGSPNYMLTRGNNALALYKVHIDWATPASSTWSGPYTMPVARYTMACKGGTCIPQPGTRQKLDSLADRLMFRLAYRNIGGVERMVVNHSVAAGKSTGIRWYEVRGMATTPAVYQQGTYGPDATYRWMGSVAMDKQGNLAAGYSFSSLSKYPGLAYATRLASDPAGKLGAETVLVSGGGSQTSGLDRWGDYTHMSVDPTDDCTFWYVGQYQKANGSFNWSTRISSFKLAACS